MENFIKCHGIIKDDLIKREKAIKISNRFYAIEGDNSWSLYNWNDERTCVFSYGEKTFIHLWYKANLVYSKKFPPVEEPKFLSACLELFSIQEKLDPKWVLFTKL